MEEPNVHLFNMGNGPIASRNSVSITVRDLS